MTFFSFQPKPGQVDFTHIRYAPVINCVVQYQSKILIVQRSKELSYYPDHWNGVAGFLDDQKSVREKVEEELHEEIGLSREHILSVSYGEIFHQEAPEYTKTWIVHPVLVTVGVGSINFNWEASHYRWIHPQEARMLKLVPGFDRVLSNLSLL